MTSHRTGARLVGAPPQNRTDSGHWQATLDELRARHSVPGAALGILVDGEIVAVASGLLGSETRVPATPDSIFQLGSATKPFTATLIMQLVEERRLDLDAPVADVLPWFRVADPEVSRSVTCRHLLTHTSGIDGDIFLDTGRGDDCIDTYTRALGEAAQIHPLGLAFSYCNTAFVVLGRIVEELRGSTWDEAVRDHIARPLGLTATVTLPDEAILHRVAVGHLRAKGGGLRQTSEWGLPRALGPAGGISATVHDLLEFVRAHLAPPPTRGRGGLLTRGSVGEMTKNHVHLGPIAAPAESWGLGWFRVRWGDERLFGHDGGAVGQRAYLRVLPSRRLAVALLTNGDNAAELADDVLREAFQTLAGVTPSPPLKPPADPPAAEAAGCVGTYRRAGILTEVFEDGGTLILRSTIEGGQAHLEPEPAEDYELVRAEADLFLMRPLGGGGWLPVRFFSMPDGTRHVLYQKRTNPQVAA